MLLSSEDQILPHRQLWKYLQELEGAADAQTIQLRRPQSGDDRAVDLHLATRRRELAENAVEERGLAAAVRADQAKDFALPHVEADAVDRFDATNTLFDAADFEDCGHGAVSSRDLATARNADAALVRRSAR